MIMHDVGQARYGEQRCDSFWRGFEVDLFPELCIPASFSWSLIPWVGNVQKHLQLLHPLLTFLGSSPQPIDIHLIALHVRPQLPLRAG
jgi:hypothetical protein